MQRCIELSRTNEPGRVNVEMLLKDLVVLGYRVSLCGEKDYAIKI